MGGCCILGYGGFVVSALGIFSGGGSSTWGTSMLKMSASCLSAVVCFIPTYIMGMDGVGFCSASLRSAAGIFTASAVNIIGKFFWAGNSSVVSDTHSYDVFVV